MPGRIQPSAQSSPRRYPAEDARGGVGTMFGYKGYYRHTGSESGVIRITGWQCGEWLISGQHEYLTP